MTTKAALEFSNREGKDCRHFNTWYINDDIKRILSIAFHKINPSLTREMEHPYVIYDGLHTLEDMLAPLVKKLSESNKKYFPFIFKPEAGAAHYMGGFLRKNKNNSISIFIFPPTGTMPRIDYGKYGYTLYLLREFELGETFEKNRFYVQIVDGAFTYSVINPSGKLVTNTLSNEQLSQLGINIDLSKSLTVDELNSQIRPKLFKILEITSQRKETTKTIDIICSPHKVQTAEKDGNSVVSCGPICVDFLDYVMSHPEYMENLNEQFELPPSLQELMAPDTYKEKIQALRQRHYNLLDQLDDERLDIIDGQYESFNKYFLNQNDKKRDGYDSDEHLFDNYLNHDLDDEEDDLFDQVSGEDDFQESSQEDDDTPSRKKDTVPEKVQKTGYTSTAELHPSCDIPKRADIVFIESQIARFRENAKSIFSINNTMKADALQSALDNAIRKNVADVRKDPEVVKALAIHRIFSFFGCKQTNATLLNEESISSNQMIV